MSALELKDTELCVMCGLCLPHCPTYAITRDEGDSPRGRIALMQALGQGRIDISNERLAFHIDRCLGCRACEAMCPSHVPFMDLMDAARAEVNRVQGINRYGAPAKQLLAMAASPAKIRLATATAGGIGFLMRHVPLSGSWARAREIFPGSANETLHVQQTVEKGEPVYLFAGCMGDLAERETLRAAEQLLATLGHKVLRSGSAGCCGAMHRHTGQPQQADDLKRKNLEAFDEYPDASVLSVATGCSVELKSYPEAFSKRHFEIMAYLASFQWPKEIEFAPLEEQVAIHIPCTQRNVLKDKLSTRALLERIPGIILSELPLSDGCCGAGGLNMLNQVEIGEALLEHSLEWLNGEQPRYVVSTNIGCTLHMQAAIRNSGLHCEVVHPLWLLARQCKAQ
jgi:glycolate oxidase iron-sulfur subunit